MLHVNESVTVRFSIGLVSAHLSAHTIDANGVLQDWTHQAPALAGEANNASFVLTVRAANPLFLPLVAQSVGDREIGHFHLSPTYVYKIPSI